MGTNILLSLIVGVAMTAIVGSQIGPNYIEQIKIKKVQTKTINNQEIIFEGIKRYVTIKQIEPNSLQDVINAGYLNPNVNDNGFTGGYTIDVDKAKGVATITTTITDKSVHEAFLNSFTNMSKPSCTGVISNKVCSTNTFKTTFVIPNEVMHGNALLMTGVPIQATPPDSNIYKYWYDTSGTKVVLKIYDGSSWKEINLGGGSVSIGSIETFAGVAAKIPEGYLLCNGQEISRTAYKDLFDVIGTTYGAGDGSTTFNVPDLRGEFIRGFDAGRGVDSGRILGSWQVDELKSHKHSYFFGGEGVSSSIGASHTSNIYSSYGNTAATGGIETRPRNIAMNYIIKH
ncbi:phage tail protein [Aliarcobacter butzleri]|uniref:phage tail protein n=1 Tax=Aliarcobacter butzleri TaxID=28197 RepID=UPI00244D4438|nr:phage tail protein [Aliarcobacter butzleri]MDH1976522.1 tail fiber protein [Aliarcobacter butzleri]